MHLRLRLQIVRSDDEAIQLMEDSEYGLTAAVFSSSEEAALSILRALPIGTGYWCVDVTRKRTSSGRPY